jgi:hypothetical protein
MATDDAKRLGYGGSAEIDGVQVLVTSATMSTGKTISYLEPYSIPPSAVSRSRVKHADGVAAYTADVSFDVTANSLALFTTAKLLSRRYSFSLGLDDGEDAELLENCYVSSLSLSGAAGGLITASMSVMAPRQRATSLIVANAFIRDEEPYGYWYSGNTDVRDWTFSMNQNVQPVYINQNTEDPKYLKVGLFDFSLQVSTYEQVQTHSSVVVATKTFTITGDTTADGHSFAGVTELGTYNHNFESAPTLTVPGAGSAGTIITVA